MRFLIVIMLLCSTVVYGQKKRDKDKDKKATEAAPVQQPAQTPAEQPAATEKPDSTKRPVTAGMILSEHFYRKYAAAMRWNDVETAKSAMYDLIVENPQNDSLIYTLGYYYYEEEKFASSLLIAQDLLTIDPKNMAYLEMAGTSAQMLGVNDRALTYFESLYLINDATRTLYSIAFIQYTLKRYAECATSINIILTKPDVDKEKVVFADAKGVDKQYPLKVSILNLKGLLALDQGDKVNAKKAFTEALAISPDFFPAKTNLEKTK